MEPLPVDIPEATPAQQRELDALAECFGCELWPDFNEEVGLWGVHWEDPTDPGNGDIIGTGEALSEAIEAARKQLREWESSP